MSAHWTGRTIADATPGDAFRHWIDVQFSVQSITPHGSFAGVSLILIWKVGAKAKASRERHTWPTPSSRRTCAGRRSPLRRPARYVYASRLWLTLADGVWITANHTDPASPLIRVSVYYSCQLWILFRKTVRNRYVSACFMKPLSDRAIKQMDRDGEQL